MQGNSQVHGGYKDGGAGKPLPILGRVPYLGSILAVISPKESGILKRVKILVLPQSRLLHTCLCLALLITLPASSPPRWV